MPATNRQRVQVRGRHFVLAWTIVFLAATGAIVVRQRAAYQAGRRVDSLRIDRDRLREARADLQSKLAALKSRPVLGPKIALLGLRTASDSEVVSLRVERAR
ncbi:MAG: hypothetical protein IPG05_11715 [Gemmatimonadetes bacterium]|nr:hypothetical protein [Gemmatimonadota bacterium]